MGRWTPPRPFLTLTGVTELQVADWDADGKPDIFVLSGDERQIGVTRLDAKGRLPFPTIIPLDGKPLTMAVGRLQPNAKPVLAVILDQDGRRSLVIRTADGKTRTQKLSDNFKSNPSSMAFHDVNQDGLADLVVLIPYEKVKVLIQMPGADFDEEDVAPPGGSVEEPWMSAADVDGDGKPELLLAQKNFIRAVVLKQVEAAAQNSTNRPGLGVQCEGPDQWRQQRFRNRRSDGGSQRNQRGPLHFPAFDAAHKVLDVVRVRRLGCLAGGPQCPAASYTAFNQLRAIGLGGPQTKCGRFSGQGCRRVDAIGRQGLGIDRA